LARSPALPDDRRELFFLRKRAILMYLDGATDDMLKEATGVNRRNVHRLIAERCLRQHEDGSLFGWRGALPFLRVKGYSAHRSATVLRDGWGRSATRH
jgi:hypothetical protein